METAREFDFTDRHFETLRSLVNDHTGIALSDAKKQLVYSRIARRLRKLGLKSFSEYCELLKTNPDDELTNFVNAITTNKTDFFRESHHFDFLAQKAMPQFLKARNLNRRIRIWSAGCSTGQEPYSIAMVLQEVVPHINNWDIKILATDIDSNVLETARQGVYEKSNISGVSPGRLKRWFRRDKSQDHLRVAPDLQRLITFKRLNLMTPWPMKGPFDLIFCRNVVIYFDKETQKGLFKRYAEILEDEGYLIVGHSESLFGISNDYQLLGQTIHQKKSEVD